MGNVSLFKRVFRVYRHLWRRFWEKVLPKVMECPICNRKVFTRSEVKEFRGQSDGLFGVECPTLNCGYIFDGGEF